MVGILGAAPLLLLWASEWLGRLGALSTSPLTGGDYEMYMEATRRWLAGGSFYLERQLAGPYQIVPGDVLYPPYALALFVPASLLPALLWWILPLSLIGFALYRLRPAALSWPILAALLWWPPTNIKVLTGNPVIWVVAAAFLGAVWAWPSVGVLLKPSLFPFAVVGIRQRSWWVALGGLLVIASLFLPMWPDYITVLRNGSNAAGIAYSVAEVPTMLLPVVAGAAATGRIQRRRRESSEAKTRPRATTWLMDVLHLGADGPPID
jgi:hypothetical protein